MRTILLTGCIAWLAATGSLAAAADPPAPPQEQASTERTDAQAVVDHYLPLLASEDLEIRQAEQRAFQQICFEAAAPGNDAERAALCQAMLNRMDADAPLEARVWMLRQLVWLSAEESVAPLAALLNDGDPRIRELARRALMKNSAAEAGNALRAALRAAAAGDWAWKRALVDALGARRETESVPALAAILAADSSERDVKLDVAALVALGSIGSEESTGVLRRAYDGGGPLRTAAAQSLLRAADGCRQDNPTAAAEVYAYLFETSDEIAVRAGAMRGLAATRGVEFRTKLIEIVTDENADVALRGVAAEEIAGLRERATTDALVDALAATPSAGAQVFLLRALAAIGDAAAQPAVIRVLKSTESDDVRIAAAEALGVLGDSEAALLLADVAGLSERPVRDAVRRVLARLDAPGVDAALIEAANAASPKTQVEALVALAARQCRQAVPDAIAQTRHDEEAVRRAAFEALETLATQAEADVLVDRLLETDDAVRPAALAAAVAACGQFATSAERVAAPLARWDGARDAEKVALVHVLGRLRGPEALAKLREARRYDDADVVDAAIRALADWNTSDVLPDLLELAKTAEQAKHRLLALRGYIRLLGEAEGYSATERVDLYRNALLLADRPEERRMALAGLGNVADIEAARLAMKYRQDEAVRAEAELATATVLGAAGLAAPQEADEMLTTIAANPANDAVKKATSEALEFVRQNVGALTRWQVAGPFVYQGHDWRDVFDAEFSPERPGQPAVEWQPLAPTGDEQPWIYDLTRFDRGGNRCVYVRTAVWSSTEQAARLDIGSDDGFKAWLNGRMVRGYNVERGHTPFSDSVPVKLNEGWNTLMLKIVQAAGEWQFSCRVRAPDETPLDGLRFAETAE